MSHQRVIPRDLFNESKLLKCMGQLSLIIHDEKHPQYPLRLEHNDADYPGFNIELDGEFHNLYVTNLTLFFKDTEIRLGSRYNSKDAYPLHFINDDGEEGEVFNDDGTLSQEFKDFLDTLMEK